jgi:hypothetical protein
MLRKLLRYEFTYYFRVFPPFYLVLGVLSLILGLTQPDGAFIDGPESVSLMVLGILYACLVVALFTIWLVMVIQRFRDNVLRDEAYLTLTLPVPVWTLTASKAASALCMFLLTLAAVVLSMLIAIAVNDPGRVALQWKEILAALSGVNGGMVAAGVLVGLIFILQQLFLAYAAMTAGRILPRFGGIAAWAAYLAVLILAVEPAVGAAYRAAGAAAFMPRLLAAGAVDLAFAALFFFVTNLLLKHTVNLE